MSNKYIVIIVGVLVATVLVILLTTNQTPNNDTEVGQNSDPVNVQPNDNQNDGQQKPGQTSIELFYYNQENDRDDNGNVLCSDKGLFVVTRVLPITDTPIQDAIKLLLKGDLTQDEIDQGASTEFPLSGFELVGANLKSEVLTLEFNDPQNKTTGGSCRVSVLWSQIEATAKQFPEVKEVRLIPQELFQP